MSVNILQKMSSDDDNDDEDYGDDDLDDFDLSALGF